MDSITKKCGVCGIEKSVDEFYVVKGKLLYSCRECERAKSKKWKQENKERHLASMKLWKKENREKVKSQPWKKTEKYAEKRRKQRRRYVHRNPEKIRAEKLKRRAILLGSEGSYTAQQWRELKNKYGNVCVCCGEEKPLTVDHVIPLSAGGTNYISNIQPLCAKCNSKKGTKTIDYRGFITRT